MYLIEDGIPIPETKQDGQTRPSGPRSELTKALDALGIGQSFAVETDKDYHKARALLARFKPRKFVTRKLAHVGWRVWRVE